MAGPATVQAFIEGPHRPAQRPGQADPDRRICDRCAFRGGTTGGPRDYRGARRIARSRADRPGPVRAAPEVRLSSPTDPRGGLRVAAGSSRAVGIGASPPPSRNGRRPDWTRTPPDRRAPARRRRPAGGLPTGTWRRGLKPPVATSTPLGSVGNVPSRSLTHCPPDEPRRLSMLIAPLTMLCTTDWRHAVANARGHFDELRDPCDAAETRFRLATGMTGLATELIYSSKSRAGSRARIEQMTLLESIGDPNLTIGLSFGLLNWFNSGDIGEIRRWSQNIIDLAGATHRGCRLPGSERPWPWRPRFAAWPVGGWDSPGGGPMSTTHWRCPATAIEPAAHW